MKDPEKWVAEQLARTLDDAARVFADAAAEMTRRAAEVRIAHERNGRFSYYHAVAMAYSAAIHALPNVSLPSAFETAALADQQRAAIQNPEG